MLRDWQFEAKWSQAPDAPDIGAAKAAIAGAGLRGWGLVDAIEINAFSRGGGAASAANQVGSDSEPVNPLIDSGQTKQPPVKSPQCVVAVLWQRATRESHNSEDQPG